jgi:hypothetical protein
MLAYGLYHPQYAFDKKNSAMAQSVQNYQGAMITLSQTLLKYYELHPEKFKYLGKDDEVDVDGFCDFVKQSGISEELYKCLREHNGHFIDPWGNEYHYYLDRNKDGYIRFRNLKESVNGYADPWQQNGFFYSKAVGVGSAHGDWMFPWTDYDVWIREKK